MATIVKSTNALYAYLNSSWVDLTSDVQETHGISADWGIDGSGPFDIVGEPGELRFVLRNDDGKYYPDGDAPLSGWGRGVPIKMTLASGGNTRTLRYYVEDIQLKVGKVSAKSYVVVTAVDWWKFAIEYPITAPSVQTQKRADEGITTLLGLISPAPQATSLDTGAYTFPAIFDSVGMGGVAYSEFVKLAMSEFGPIYLTKDSTYGEALTFENITHRNSGAIAATISANIDDVELDYGEDIVNHVTVRAYPKRFDTEPQVLYSLARPIPIKAGETLADFRVKYIDPSGGGRPVHAIVSSMRTPEVPGATDPYLMTLLNFHGGMYDETTRHTWDGHDCLIVNDVYQDAYTTRIPGAILGHYTVFGGYPDYRLTTASSADFDFGDGAFTVGWYENRLNTNAGLSTLARDDTYFTPYVFGYSNGTNLLLYISSDGTSYDIAHSKSMGQISQSKWTYYEVCRDDDGWFRTFQDGKLITKWYSSLAIMDGLGGNFSIGYAWGGWGWFGFDSFFVKKGECLHKSDFDPPKRLITPTLDGDYLMNTAEDGSGTNLSSSLSITATYDATGVTYSLTNNSSQDAYIIHLQAVGKGVYAEDTQETYVQDATSITTNRHQKETLDQKYQQTLNAGVAIATSIVAAEKDPRTALKSVSYYANRSATTMSNFITLDIGSLIRVTVSGTGIDNYYHINKITFKVKAGGIIQVKYGVRPAYNIDPDFAGGGGGGGEGDDGLVGIGGGLGGLQTGIYQEQYLETVTVSTIPTVTPLSIYQEQYLGTANIVGYVERHNLLSIQHEDTTAADVVRGDIVTGQGATPKWVRLAASIPGGAALLNVLGFVNGDTEPAWKALFDATNPTTIQPDDAASPGTATVAAHRDHTHAIAAAAPGTNITPEQANAEGTSTSFARSDHMHYIPSGAASEIAGVQAAAEGTGAAFARTDHAHQIQHGITDNHIVTIDHASVADNDYAKFTANGLEGRSYSEVRTDLNLTNNHIVFKTISDPGGYYTYDRAQVPLFSSVEGALTITRIVIRGADSTPTSEIAGDLKFADDIFTGSFANATVIDVCDTTNGAFTATSGFNDATVPSGKYIYFQFDSLPHADWKDMFISVTYTLDST